MPRSSPQAAAFSPSTPTLPFQRRIPGCQYTGRRAAPSPGTPSPPLRRALLRASAPPPAAAAPPVPDARAELLRLVTPPAGGRGRALPSDTQERVAALVAGLEAAAPPPGGTAFLPAIAGRWTLLYTSRPPSASPIQRAVTGVGSLDVVQELTFDGGAAEASTGRLRNEVRWPGGVLYVCAAITGVEDGRLAIAFDEAWADVSLPWGDKTVRVPYPVPFKLLGSIARGWLDVTHVGGGVRICRGNKGSAFVLVREGLDEGGA
ncbi:hypothetical protein BU14_0077s0050 [Porphyra umbilicalis]|uniref:Plastid lipid-associated protein/fibrillin conserved domain-containing protein n=1 Tax=Porphyra umbilicalis TaxID=2786 RepID=A0A1X6PF20_PORUM|nr:hypothetical protein BU14_0077s0050 [Porphyra umbilicalis]|eukprot:OSX79430.1 hypothetical protein BU14_0077s0050 [Porphyra umbilicalis]